MILTLAHIHIRSCYEHAGVKVFFASLPPIDDQELRLEIDDKSESRQVTRQG